MAVKSVGYLLRWSAVGAASLLATGYGYEVLAEFRDKRRFPPPGQRIDIGTHRLHLLNKGAGQPTVIIEQGAGGPAILSLEIQDQIARFTQVCIYDRAGFQWSDPPPGTQTLLSRVADLYLLLNKAKIRPPYVLVGHSLGGLLVRLFAQAYPATVAGLVLVDSVEEALYLRPEILALYRKLEAMQRIKSLGAQFGLARLWRKVRPLHALESRPDSVQQLTAASVRAQTFAYAADDVACLRRELARLSNSQRLPELGDLPLAVITHGVPFAGSFSLLEKDWPAGQERLAALSTNSLLLVAERAGHVVFKDDPAIVIEAVRRVVTAVRAGRPLRENASD